jgi:hypothetical protein
MTEALLFSNSNLRAAIHYFASAIFRAVASLTELEHVVVNTAPPSIVEPTFATPTLSKYPN